jgi:hypothetical protein
VCIHIAVADDLTKIAIWDPDEVRILIARATPLHELMRELRAILVIDLGAPAEPTGGLLCFCGAQLELPRELTAVTADSAAM